MLTSPDCNSEWRLEYERRKEKVKEGKGKDGGKKEGRKGENREREGRKIGTHCQFLIIIFVVIHV